MTTITENSTVGEVASSFPTSIPLFQQAGIDFCCGGNKTLADVCRDKGLSVEGLIAGVAQAQQPAENTGNRDWSSATLSELIDHILAKHHAYLRNEWPRLSSMLAKVIEAHGKNHGESLQPLGRFYSGLRRELEEHMWKEENILFPLIRQMEQAVNRSSGVMPGMPVGGPIQMMEHEHESAGNALREMRKATEDYRLPDDACATYKALFDGLKAMEADLHQHIHLENNILFPRSLALGE